MAEASEGAVDTSDDLPYPITGVLLWQLQVGGESVLLNEPHTVYNSKSQ